MLLQTFVVLEISATIPALTAHGDFWFQPYNENKRDSSWPLYQIMALWWTASFRDRESKHQVGSM